MNQPIDSRPKRYIEIARKFRSRIPDYVSKTLIALVGAIGVIGGAIGSHYFAAHENPTSTFELWSPPSTDAEHNLEIYRYDKANGKTWKLKAEEDTQQQVWLPVEETSPQLAHATATPSSSSPQK